MTTLRVLPFTRQPDGDETVIGLPERGVFLALPHEALELVDRLADGATPAEAAEEYRRRHGEEADVDDLVAVLLDHGFLEPTGGPADAEPAVAAPGAGARREVRFHLAGLPVGLARRLVGAPAAGAAAAVVGAGTLLWLRRPELRFGWRDLVFAEHTSALLLALMLAGFATTLLHELAHLTAARARGVDCRLGIGHRLWILVAETDLTGLWKLPRGQRYLPLLAGMALDLVSAALVVLALAAGAAGWLPLPAPAADFIRALGTIYLLRVAWQGFFFVRTDLYYVFATRFGCKDLMGDTQRFLANRLARLRGRPEPHPQGHIPRGERRAIRAYAAFWLAGRVAAFALLFTVTLPVLAAYTVQIGRDLSAGPAGDFAEFAGSAAVALLSLAITSAGFFLWIRSAIRSRRSHA